MFKTKMRSMKKLHLIGVITLLAPLVSVASVATDSSHSTKAVNSNDSMDTITVDIHQCGAGVSLWKMIERLTGESSFFRERNWPLHTSLIFEGRS